MTLIISIMYLTYFAYTLEKGLITLISFQKFYLTDSMKVDNDINVFTRLDITNSMMAFKFFNKDLNNDFLKYLQVQTSTYLEDIIH